MNYVEEKIESRAKSKETKEASKNRKTTTLLPPSAATELNWYDTFLNSTDPFFDDLPTPEPTPELKMNFTMFTEPLTKGVQLYMDNDQQVGGCLDEYHNVLRSTGSWVKNIRELTDEMIQLQRFTENVYNYTEEESILRKDEILVETYYYKYAYDKISKLDFLKHFQSDEHSREVCMYEIEKSVLISAGFRFHLRGNHFLGTYIS